MEIIRREDMGNNWSDPETWSILKDLIQIQQIRSQAINDQWMNRSKDKTLNPETEKYSQTQMTESQDPSQKQTMGSWHLTQNQMMATSAGADKGDSNAKKNKITTWGNDGDNSVGGDRTAKAQMAAGDGTS